MAVRILYEASKEDIFPFLDFPQVFRIFINMKHYGKSFRPERCRTLDIVVNLFQEGKLIPKESRMEDPVSGGRYLFLKVVEKSNIQSTVTLLDERTGEKIYADNNFFQFRNLHTAPAKPKTSTEFDDVFGDIC